MAYLNTAVNKKAKAVTIQDCHPETPLEEYDFNYCYDVKALESEAIKLVPFVPSLHAKEAWQSFGTEEGRAMSRYMPFEGPSSHSELLIRLERYRRDPIILDFAIFDKVSPDTGVMAGMISYINSEPNNLALEIGAVYIFPKYQRTHVNTHANALLLRYAFEELKLRRVQWRANMLNAGSIAAAKRLGFEMEGVLKWHRVLPAGKEGLTVTDSQDLGSPEAGPGRHSANFSVTWESWRDGVKARIDGLMAREVKRQ